MKLLKVLSGVDGVRASRLLQVARVRQGGRKKGEEGGGKGRRQRAAVAARGVARADRHTRRRENVRQLRLKEERCG